MYERMVKVGIVYVLGVLISMSSGCAYGSRKLFIGYENTNGAVSKTYTTDKAEARVR